MPTTLRVKIIKLKKNRLIPHQEAPEISQDSAFKKDLNAMLSSTAVPYVVAPILFLLWMGLQWWHWYEQTPMSPLPLTLLALGLIIFCIHKLLVIKKRKQEEAHPRFSPRY